MTDSATNPKKTKRNRFLLDRTSQVTVAYRVVTVLAGMGLLYAAAVWVLLGSDLIVTSSLGRARLVLLSAQAAYFLVGGAVLLITTLLLTHRFAGPAVVMEKALRGMRRGDYDVRLSTRDKDFHKILVAEMRAFRDELVERETTRASMLAHLDATLDAGDIAAAREVLEEMRAPATASAREPVATA